MSSKSTAKEVENVRLNRSDDLCKLAEMLGYRRSYGGQLTCNNGAEVSSLLDFFDDNPGAMSAIHDWVMENIDAYDLPEDRDANEEECPGCGCCPGDGLTEGCNHPEGCGYWRAAKEEAEKV